MKIQQNVKNKTKVNILIIEDEIIIAAELAQILGSMGYTISGMAVNYSNAVSLLESEKPDMAIVDINLGGSKTGVDVGSYINDHNKIPFIYLTSNSDKQTVDSAILTKPAAYLLKPFDKTAIYTSISLAIRDGISNEKLISLDNNEDLIIRDALFVKEKDLYHKVPFSIILYFKSDKNYIEIFTTGKTYLIRSTIGNLLQELPGNQFVKVHRSYVVNVSKITAINSEVLYIENVNVPLSYSYRDKLISQVKTFL